MHVCAHTHTRTRTHTHTHTNTHKHTNTHTVQLNADNIVTNTNQGILKCHLVDTVPSIYSFLYHRLEATTTFKLLNKIMTHILSLTVPLLHDIAVYNYQTISGSSP